MLKILLTTCQTALEGLRAADNPLDAGFVRDIEGIVARTEAELARWPRSSPAR
jgi:hypothetical protein